MFDLIKQNVNIVSHIEQFVELKQKGKILVGKCIFHDEKTASFTVYPEGSFFCYGCSVGGTVIDFESIRQNISPTEAATLLCEKYNLHPTAKDSFRFQQQVSVRKKKESWLEALTNSFEGRVDIYEYVKNRGLSDQTIKDFQLGAGASTNVVVIPINDKFGRIVGFARRNLDKDAEEKYLNDATDMVYNKSEILYNLDRAKKSIKKNNSIIINEGYFDVMSLWESDIKNAVAFCSSRVTREQAKVISEVVDENGVIYFVPTNDKAAYLLFEKNVEQVRALCPKNHIRCYNINDDCKDLNDVLIKYGTEGVRRLQENTIPLELFMVKRIIKTEPIVEAQYQKVKNYCRNMDNHLLLEDICGYLAQLWGKSVDSVKTFLVTKKMGGEVDQSHFKTMSQLINEYDEYVGSLSENRIGFGWAKTDGFTRGMRIGDVIQFIASSSVGKTIWAENLIINLSKNHGELPLMFFSLEQMGVMAFERFAMMEGSLESYEVERWNKNEDEETRQKLMQTITILSRDYKNFVLIDEGGMTLPKLENYVTHAGITVFDRPVKIIVIDYLGYLQGEGKDLYHKVSAISKDLKELAKRLKCVVVSLHQVNRAGRSGGEPIESHHARDSGVVTESADIMISAWRPELKEGITEDEKRDLDGVFMTKIVKNRYGVTGAQIEFMFVKRYLKLYEKRDEPISVGDSGQITGRY